MARIRSVDFLPEIFQTPTNKKFLNSTLDQLIQEPKLKQTQGYIGRRNAPGKSATDGYVLEPTARREQYQLEPGVIFKDDNGKTVDALTYMGLLDALETEGANVENHDRLFTSETYSWSPFIDFDKFVNYSQYYWLPNGPGSVNVTAAAVFLTNEFAITATDTSYSFADFPLENPDLTVLRGGTYTFDVDQIGFPFYIQAQPGVDGTMPWADNISSRDVLGVTNNGEDVGTVTFVVPAADAQDFYHSQLTSVGNVDLATEEPMTAIKDQLLEDVIPLLGIENLDAKTIIFLSENDSEIYRIQLDDTTVPGSVYVRLVSFLVVTDYDKFTIQYGEVYSNIDFYVAGAVDPDGNTQGDFARAPLETASLDTLYYQDAVNPNRQGIINVVDQESAAIIHVDDIIGAPKYTSPNGIIFTNGLKVQLRGQVLPVEYIDQEYYVEGVGEAIRLVAVTDLVVPEAFSEGFTTPWDIEPWDAEGWDDTLNAPVDQDYLTINRASQDLNAWTRSNRWFHIDVIRATAEYNSSDFVVDNEDLAARPIIEFDADIRLFNYGTHSKQVINVIDFNTTDAMSTINGYEMLTAGDEIIVDGYALRNGSRIIFANDNDPDVRDKIYLVEVIDPDGDLPGGNIINLVLADDSDSEVDDMVICSTGLTLRGKVFNFDGTTWTEAQQKISVNQAPLFDMYDVNGYSFNDFGVYPSTTFNGTMLFSYEEGTGANDPVLDFPLTYLNIDNLGDIVFDNNLYTDTFLYVRDSVSEENAPIHVGSIRKYTDRTTYTNEFGWDTSVELSRQAQVFDIIYAGEPIEIDVLPATDLTIPAVTITTNGTFVPASSYTVVGNVITFLVTVATGTEVQIKVISDEISEVGYYEIPTNIASNMFNENTDLLTLGTIRNHYNALAQNIVEFEGQVNGANNIRDLGDVSKYGNLIVQQSSPVALAAMFLRNKEYNYFSSLDFVSQQYEKFKNQLIDWVEKNDVYGLSVSTIVDTAIKDINVGKTPSSAFHWTDMLPTGEDYDTTVYTITAISTDSFTTLNTYDFLNANTQAMLVYHGDELLIKDLHYTVATDGPRITLLKTLAVDDVLTINEYSTTIGSNVPSTPTKLGMFPKFRPEIYEDDSYVTPVDVIRGHDGSITTSFGKNADGENDIRDLVLLEFEKRVYNNIKVNDAIPVSLADIIPGEFRTTDYTNAEVNTITATSFLSWVGWNRIDYKKQDYNQAEEKTWNYSTASCKLDGEQLNQANWRGIYLSFYDTDAPHLRPWEMVGLFERPDWWVTRYGSTPYTSGNLVLWDDMEAGIIRDPTGNYVDERFVRPGLTSILPVDSLGDLVMPLQSVIGNYTQNDFKRSWQIGDVAPAESAWKKSSAWPFAMQRLYALAKPAQYFSLMADRDLYVYDDIIGQFLYDNSRRLDARTVDVQDESLVKHSYINWITEYNRYHGYNSVNQLKTDLSNLDVNLCHHMASFTDKNNLKIFTDKSSPDSTNSSLLLPDESYNLLMYKNQPVDEIIYSAMVVQKVVGGYAVTGNSTTDPYFKIQTAVATGKFESLRVGRTEKTSTTVRVPLDYTDDVEIIPYGTVFTSKQAVSEFLVGYNEYLVRTGLQFNTYEGANPVNWTQMVQEFIYWAGQGWAVNSIINLNPAATQLEFERELHVVDDLNNLELTEQPLNQNREPLDISNYVVDRLDNNFKLRMIDNNIIGYLKFNLTSFEHLLVLDNVSIFNDLIYDPVTGVRQQRVKLSGFTTYEWNGQLDAQGFLYNEDNVQEWSEVNTYNKGDIIKFKNVYWSAAEKVQPSETFDFGQWVKTDYESINKGLLPNLATKSDQMLQYYNNKTANLESDIDLLAYGLTGFRSRDYLRSLDLDDISQVNIYSDMIENKGTANSLNLFQGVELNKEVVDYTIFENWALRRARYGATSNRNYIELQLDEDVLGASPSLVEVIDGTITESISDLIIPVENIYKQSVKNTTADIFPIRTSIDLDVALPSAGLVDSNDVDISVFDIDGLSTSITIVEGTLVWVAKDTETDWNVYRTIKSDATVIKVTDNLDGTLTLETDIAHGFVIDDTVVISEVDVLVDGTTKVTAIFDDTNFVIAGELATNQTCILNIEGVLLQFESARVDVPSDIAGSIFDNNINVSETVWVANDNGKSATYKKADPFTLTRDADNPDGAVSDYGTSVAQGYNSAGMLVGDPTANTAYFYNKQGADDYIYAGTSTINNVLVDNYGEDVALMSNWGTVGAPGVGAPGVASVINRDVANGTILTSQILVSENNNVTDNGFGSTVTMSQDENWIYVSEPLANSVHAYERLPYQIQSMQFLGDGITVAYDISNDIIVDTATQLNVAVANVLLAPGTDYTYAAGILTLLTVVPGTTDEVFFSRKDLIAHAGTGAQTNFLVTDLMALDGIESLAVTVDSVLQVPGFDYTFNGTEVVFGVAPPVGTDNVRIAISAYRPIGTIDGTTFDASTVAFGTAVDTSVNGSTLVVTAPSTNTNVGTAYMIDRVIERFVITDANILTYTTNRTPSGSVFNNSVRLRKEGLNTDYQYTVSGNDIILEPGAVAIGDFLDVTTSEFKIIQQLILLDPISASNIVADAYYEIVAVSDTDYTLIGAPDNNIGTRFTATGPDINPDPVGDPNYVYGTALEIRLGATFGNDATICKSKCSVYIGAENDLDEAGSVTRFVNTSRMVGSITSTLNNPSMALNDSIRINNVEVILEPEDQTEDGTPTGTPLLPSEQLVKSINRRLIPNVTASASVNGNLTIELVNKNILSLANKLDVLPGNNITLAELGINTYYIGQAITSPDETANAHFGSAVTIDLNLNQLVVAAENGDMVYDTTYTVDSDIIRTDASNTVDTDALVVINTGVVYTYDLLSDGGTFTPGKLVLGQQFLSAGTLPGDKFGSAISLVDGVLVVSSLEHNTSIGKIDIYANATNELSWTATTVQNDTVDVELINSVNIYDSETLNVNRYLDYIDPLNGKILGAAKENIDLITVTDPTVYNNTFRGVLWGPEQTGTIWWDISQVRFLDYNLGNARLASKLWGKVFAGSSIDVYQWVESVVVPAEYTGTGTVYDVDKYITISEIDKAGTIKNTYYYWVNKVETISVNSDKTLSAAAIADYIESPASSGISYAAFVAKNIVALYNCKDIISDTQSVLYVEYDQTRNSNNVFVEYDLFRENHPTDFLSDSLYKKLQDSFCGVDDIGNLVPDMGLSLPDRFGIEFRPRKSMFIDRLAALTSYMEKVNGILAQYTIAESRAYPLLDSEEPTPTVASGAWNIEVATYEELTFQDFTGSVGIKYLVDSDENTGGLWTIYEVTADETLETLQLVDIQAFDTKRFWNLAHWYASDYDVNSKIDYVVNEVSGLTALTNVENNAVARVLHNSVGSWEIHQLSEGVWDRVGLENGTIQFDSRLWDYSYGRYGFDVEVFSAQNFDEEPVQELRQIIRSINEELLIGNLAVDRNQAILSVFNYVLAEQPHADWLHKTSMIDVTQKVRSLSQYAVYQKDNQDYLNDYITEAKPYHTKVKDFMLNYDGLDVMEGQVTDFDCPSTYNEAFDQYISPILDDGNAILVTDPSNTPPTSDVWQTEPWKQWYENYRLAVAEVAINNGGSGYTIAPRVVVTGDNTVPAEMSALLGLGGVIAEVRVDNPGAGYLTAPTITFEGGNGVDAAATARMENTLVRTFLTTMKYDRYEYESKIVNFSDNDVTTTRNLVFKYDGTLLDTNVDELLVDTEYKIVVLGDTDWTTVGAVEDTDGNFVISPHTEYIITDPGTTDFIAIGAKTGKLGERFIATGIGGSGTGTAVRTIFTASAAGTGTGVAKEEPVLYRLLADADTSLPLYANNDNNIFLPQYFEEVLYWVSADGTKVYHKDAPGNSATGLDAIEMKYFKEGIASWYELDGAMFNENDNSESRNFVRYNDQVWKMITFANVPDFLASKYERVDDSVLGGIDRVSGYYVSDVNNPGLDLSLLINGIAYPGVEVAGDGFDVTEEELDAIYESEFLDTYLGTRPTDVNIDGSQFIDTLHSHAPEELVPCSIFDTLDIKVFSRPGSDYLRDGHAFDVGAKVYTTSTSFNTFSFADIVTHPIKVLVADMVTGKMFYENRDFTIDWANQDVVFNAFSPEAAQFGFSYFADLLNATALIAGATCTISALDDGIGGATTDFTLIGAADNNIGTQFIATGPGTGTGTALSGDAIFGSTGEGTTIKIFVYEIGGGNQLHRAQMYGIDVINPTVDATSPTGDSEIAINGPYIHVPVLDSEIFESIVFVNGVETAVTPVHVDTQTTALVLPVLPADTDFITATIMGIADPQYLESYPVTQTSIAPALPDMSTELFDMYKENAIVEVNGLRLRPPEGTRVIADGVAFDYMFPTTGGLIYDNVADNEVTVYINGEAQTLGVDFTVSPINPSSVFFGSAYFGSAVFAGTPTNIPRWVTLAVAPAAGDIVNVYIRTLADYWWAGTVVDFVVDPANGDHVAITTYKDDSELDLLTQVFAGPTIIAQELIDNYDSGQYDSEDYDFVLGTNSVINLFELTRVTRETSLWVTVNGERIHAGTDYQIINDTELLLTIPVLDSADVLAVTSITDNIVTNGVAYRLFKDMRDNVGMYKMSETYLTQDLLDTDDIIYVADASVLGQPDLAIAKFGILMVNGERITYRDRGPTGDPISSIDIATGTDYIITESGNTDFTLIGAPNNNEGTIFTANGPGTGTGVTRVYIANTVSGLRRGVAGTGAPAIHTTNDIVYDTSEKSLVQWDYDQVWYEQGTGTASDGVPLQDQTTSPAVFIKS